MAAAGIRSCGSRLRGRATAGLLRRGVADGQADLHVEGGVSGSGVAAANAAAFRELPRRRGGWPRPGSAPAAPGFADEPQRDCFVGASLTAKPTYTWRVA